jgi:phage baseplate assembly protein V
MTARTEGIDELALPDMERRTANAIRYGRIMAVDYANARVRVKSGDIESAWLPWSTGRASGAKRRWDPPEVGEQVVMLSPGGDMRQAVVLTGVFQQSAGAPSDSADKDTTVYGDGTVVEYDRGSRTLLVNFGGTSITARPAAITLTVGGVSLAVSASGVAITGGMVTHNGTNIGDTHTHEGSPSAPPGPRSNTGAPT